MTNFEKLAREFCLEEATLESIVLDRGEDIYLVLRIYDGNASIYFQGDLDSRFPQRRLVLKCRRYIFFNIDRLTPYGNMELLTVHDQEATEGLQDLQRTIIGWSFLTDSKQLSQLGLHASAFRHLVCETVGVNIELIFEGLEILTSLPDHYR